MLTKVLYYREIGEAPKLRQIHKRAKESKDGRKLEIAMSYLEACLKNPVYVENYERKIYGK